VLPDQYVIPGNIIYKQRGTIWHPGVNTILGRDHTIHAAVAGYVKYYRDPARHPKRQYIGVAFNREDQLPYPRHAIRKRKLGMIAVPRRNEDAGRELVGASGIPLRVIRKEGEMVAPGIPDVAAESSDTPIEKQVGSTIAAQGAARKKRTAAAEASARARTLRIQQATLRRNTRVLRLQSDYSYRESNWEIGRLVGPVGRVAGTWRLQSRKARFRGRRKAANKKFAALKAERVEREMLKRQKKAERKAVRLARKAAEAKGKGNVSTASEGMDGKTMV
jgi:protein phosphatase inhibitor 2